MTRRHTFAWLSLLLVFVAGAAVAQTTETPAAAQSSGTTGFASTVRTMPLEIELGYRWLDLDGSSEMYRTQLNEREGLLLRALTISSNEFGGSRVFDHFRLDVSEFGTGPAGSVRLEAGRAELYAVRMSYRQADAFSAYPGLANPFLDGGIVPGQHTYDRERTMFDADIEFLPGRSIVPFLGYSSSTYSGPGSTTYALGLDEFRLASDLDETEREIRAGAGFSFGKFNGSVVQGWRDLSSSEKLTLIPGTGGGNNAGPILGTPITADRITRDSEMDVTTPFTNAFVTAQLHSRVRVIGNFVRFAADADGFEDESSAGSFASFALRRFFTGLDEQVSSRAKNTTWRGGARAEFSVNDKVELFVNAQRESRELDGNALVQSLYLQSITFGGVDRRDFEELLDATSSLGRDEDTLEAGFSARSLGPFSVRGSYRQLSQDLSVAPDLAEIVIGGPEQGGEFERTIKTVDLSASFARAGFLLGVAARRDQADAAFLRTDYRDRDRLRVRAEYALPNRWGRIGVTAEETNQDNDRFGIGYDGRIRQLTGDVEVAPLRDRLRLRAAYSKFEADSTVRVRRPENFEIIPSVHAEDGNSIEGGFSLFFAPVTFEGDMSRYENSGSNPFDLDRMRARLVFDVFAHAGIAAEYAIDEYTESLIPAANYKASRIGLYLRWRQ
jgi:hypothetical protein